MRIRQLLNWIVISYIMSAFIAIADQSIDAIQLYDTEYQPGIGLPVGEITLVNGQVVIVHLKEELGYSGISGMNVYRGDLILTAQSANVVILLKDGSQIAQGAGTRIQLNQVVHNPRKRTRSIFLKMSSGKARFSVNKLKSYQNRQFRIKTMSALIGVRGSDFVVQVAPDQTQVAAFEDTELSLVGLELPEMPPVILRAFEQSSIGLGESPTSPIPLSIEEMDGLKYEFQLNKQAMTQKQAKEQEASTEKKQIIRISDTDKKTSTRQLSVDAESLQAPLMEFGNEIKRFENERLEANTYISQQKHEIATELPDFPVFP
ncbi:MAG: FecR protein [Candidatus Magnetoglobus multicellularis str. Araruama]|uniref:FecR protein n=1 Tax=Candidatus Magnetoglobus multicellularis str. Araruama TaxID=890399 RepID=A0A1V1PC46_9BACT|nr:MAG: FecR protein [Candidatus Magnetoglobus multicellularis str. Araruama]